MKFVADESVDKIIVDNLRKEGYRVIYIAELKRSISDNKIINIANTERSILITSDKDFGEVIFRRKKTHYGVILTRLEGLSPYKKRKLC